MARSKKRTIRRNPVKSRIPKKKTLKSRNRKSHKKRSANKQSYRLMGGSMDTEPQPEGPASGPQGPAPGPQPGPQGPASGPQGPQPGPASGGPQGPQGPLKLPGQAVQETIKPPSLLARELKDALANIYKTFRKVQGHTEPHVITHFVKDDVLYELEQAIKVVIEALEQMAYMDIQSDEFVSLVSGSFFEEALSTLSTEI